MRLLLLRGGGGEEAALRMIRLMCGLLARWEMNRRAGHLYSSKHSIKQRRLVMVAIRRELDIRLISACEWKQTCCGRRRIQPLALWRMCERAGHLHSSERICSEHRFMQKPRRSRLEVASISVCAGVLAGADSARFPREQQQCTFESHHAV